jgi:hypothetical protein
MEMNNRFGPVEPGSVVALEGAQEVLAGSVNYAQKMR